MLINLGLNFLRSTNLGLITHRLNLTWINTSIISYVHIIYYLILINLGLTFLRSTNLGLTTHRLNLTWINTFYY